MDDAMLVSVCMITYNHENYIAQAIEGIISQKAYFNIELVIGNDCSGDKTGDIIFEYYKKYPDIIRIYNRNKNIGMISNFIETINECEGEYIAFCEGDDYWVDQFKLQKQMDILQKDTKCGLVFTNHFNQYEFLKNKIIKVHNKIQIESPHIQSEILRQNFIGTLTVMVKMNLLKSALSELDLLNKNWASCDTPLWFVISQYTKIAFLQDYTSVYRIHDNSASSKSVFSKSIEDTDKYWEMALYLTGKYNTIKKYHDIIAKQIYLRYLRIALQHNKNEIAYKYTQIILKNKLLTSYSEKAKYTLLYYLSLYNKIWSIVHMLFRIKLRFRIYLKNFSLKP